MICRFVNVTAGGAFETCPGAGCGAYELHAETSGATTPPSSRSATRRRVTRVGRFLRRTSIDELPQLFNVLGGEMSLVGPRPHAQAHDSAFDAAVADYALRHNVKPGITGWAQVNGSRGETPDAESVRRRVEHDVWYIDNWCLLIELKILIRTVRVCSVRLLHLLIT